MVTRRTFQRSVTTRPVFRRPTQVRRPISGSIADRARDQREQQEQKKRVSEFLNTVGKNINIIFSGSNSLSSAESKGLNYVNSLNVTPSVRSQVANLYRRELQVLKNKQNRAISEIKKIIANNEDNRAIADRKNQRAKELGFEKRIDIGKGILSQLNRGQLINLSTAKRNIIRGGEAERSLQEKKVTQKKQTEQLVKAEIFAKSQAKKGKPISAGELRKRFDISLSQASSLSKIQPKVIKVKEANLEPLLQQLQKEINIFKVDVTPQTRDISIAPFKSAKFNKRFKELPASQKRQLAEFNYILSSKNSAISGRDVNLLKKDIDDLNKLNKVLKADPKLKRILNLGPTGRFEKINIDKDIKNYNKLIKTTNSNIKDRVKSGKTKDLVSLSNSVNKLIKLENQINKARLQSLSKKINSKLAQITAKEQIFKGTRALIPLKTKPLEKLVLTSQLITLQNKLRNNQVITRKEFKEVFDSLDDLSGVKTAFKKFKTKQLRIQKVYAPNIIRDTKRYFQGTKFAASTLLLAVKIALRDIKNLAGLLGKAGKGIYNTFILDIADLVVLKPALKAVLNKNLLPRTTRAVKKAKNKIKYLTDNPEVFALGVAGAIALGQRQIRNTVVNNPKRAIAEVVSLFVDDIFLTGGVRAVKKVSEKISDVRKTAKFKKVLRSSLASNVNPSVIPTDFAKESLEALVRKKARETVILDKDGSPLLIISKTKTPGTKQLTLLKEQSFKKFFPDLDVPKKLKPDAKILWVDKKNNLFVKVTPKPKTFKQSKLSDFARNTDIKLKSGDTRRFVPEFNPRKTIYITEFDGKPLILEVPVKKKGKITQKNLNNFFKNKKGQARLKLLQKQDVKKVIDTLQDRKKEILSVTSIVKKAKRTREVSKLLRGLFLAAVVITRLINGIRSLGLLKEEALRKELTLRKEAKARAKAKAKAKAKQTLKQKAKQEQKIKQQALKKEKVTTVRLPSFRKVPNLKKVRIKFKWKDKPPRGNSYLVNAIVRIKGQNRLIPLKTTPNKAIKKIGELIDNSTSRSFQLVIVGLTKRKDIAVPAILKKFRFKKSINSPVLRLVEKSKFAIDTPGEKTGLKISKLIKGGSVDNRKRTRKTKSKSKRSRKVRKNRKPNTKRTKSKPRKVSKKK